MPKDKKKAKKEEPKKEEPKKEESDEESAEEEVESTEVIYPSFPVHLFMHFPLKLARFSLLPWTRVACAACPLAAPLTA